MPAVQVTEASLADVFKDTGRIVDCRVCGDPNSAMRFAFIEFAEEAAVQQVCTSEYFEEFPHLKAYFSNTFKASRWPWLNCILQAIKLNGVMLGKFPIRVMPSKTAIVPVNTSFLPRTQEELERCARTVYIANIDKEVEREDVRVFFKRMCGEPTDVCATPTVL